MKLTAAPNAYLAGALEDALQAAGIACVQLTNEIPMAPGFNFGAGPYAEIFVQSSDELQARQVLADVQQTISGAEHDCATAFPAVINVRSTPLIGRLLLMGWVVVIGFSAGNLLGGYYVSVLFYPSLYVLDAVITIALIYVNWPRVQRLVSSLGVGLLALPVVALYMFYELFAIPARLLLRLPLLLRDSPR